MARDRTDRASLRMLWERFREGDGYAD